MSKLAILRSSASARTRWTIAALAVGAAVVIVFAGALGGRVVSPSTAGRQPPKPDAADQVKPTSTSDSPEVAARAFLSSYVSFLYGRKSGAAVTPVGARLHQALLGAQPTPTPAERARTLVIHDLTVGPGIGTTTATGNAVIDDGASPPYALSFNLTFTHRHWLVTRVQKGDR